MTAVTYHDFDTEAFNMDALGNRTGDQTLRDDGTVDFTVDSATNRYSSVGGNSISHDDAGNMTVDKDGYQYTYDYENRVVRIEDVNDVEVATHDYDALGRRIRVIDKSADPDVTTLYYYNPEWQVLAEYNGSNELQRYYVYGNYIDEPLMMSDGTDDYYYVQDHLYSTVALIGYVDPAWVIVERCEYDAYGKMARLNPDFTAWTGTEAGNPYYFTGRRFDFYADGPDPSGHYRHRTYDTYTARFLQYDPRGINPAGGPINRFGALGQYVDGVNLYEYVGSRPIHLVDPFGLESWKKVCCKITEHKSEWLSKGDMFDWMKHNCWQRTILNPKGMKPEAACRCHYKNKPNITVYEAHEGECKWCSLSHARQGLFGLPGGFPGMAPPGITHAHLNVKCEKGIKSWSANVIPPWPAITPMWVNTPVKVEGVLSGLMYRFTELGSVSQSVADKYDKLLPTETFRYSWPLNDCSAFVYQTAIRMLSDCP